MGSPDGRCFGQDELVIADGVEQLTITHRSGCKENAQNENDGSFKKFHTCAYTRFESTVVV